MSDSLLSPEGWPGVTVVVAARNAAGTLRPCLASLKALDYSDVEIIVVDDGSTDDTAALARAAGARVLSAGGRGPSAARNLGVQDAREEIVAFTDADCTVPAGWLRVLVAALRDRKAAGAGGPQRNVFPVAVEADAADLDAFFALAAGLADYTRVDDRAREVEHNASCNVAYVKHTVVEAGGFPEGMFPGEDVDLDYRVRRLGYRCWYDPRARVEHHRPGTRTWFARMMRRYGRAQRELVSRYGRFRLQHYVPAGLGTLAALQLLLARRTTRSLALGLDALLALGAVGVLTARVPLARWAPVTRYAGIALGEWLRGYAEGLRDSSGRWRDDL